jgi:Na+/citrate or Na+/malate symporter
MRRMTRLAILTAVVAAAVVYLQVTVPLPGPSLTHADAIHYWPVAVIAGLSRPDRGGRGGVAITGGVKAKGMHLLAVAALPV